MTKRIIKRLAWLAFAGIIITAGLLVYLFNKPHRNVQKTEVFAEIKIKDLLNEFLADAAKANAKYLSGDGNSKVLVVEGRVYSITANQKNEKVVLLKEEDSKAGVSCTFTAATNANAETLKPGDIVKIKGALTAGNSYEAGLDLYNHAILIQCDIIK